MTAVELLEPVGRHTSAPAHQSASAPVDQPADEMTKVTVYMPAEAEEALHQLWKRLQGHVARRDERKLTKGDILAAALEIALERWEEGTSIDELAAELVAQYNRRVSTSQATSQRNKST